MQNTEVTQQWLQTLFENAQMCFVIRYFLQNENKHVVLIVILYNLHELHL